MSLSPYWESHYDAQLGKMYYLHRLSKVKQYEFPGIADKEKDGSKNSYQNPRQAAEDYHDPNVGHVYLPKWTTYFSRSVSLFVPNSYATTNPPAYPFEPGTAASIIVKRLSITIERK
jgi:hypothetical protein